MVAGIVALLLISAGVVLLHRRGGSNATLVMLIGMTVLWLGSLIQIFSGPGDISYIKDNGEILGATGTFPNSWYVGRVAFYSGLLVSATGFLWHALAENTDRQDDA